jgi:integrase
MTTPLTAVAVRKLRHGKQRREIRDAGCRGLVLIVQPSGHKSWAMRFRRPGGRLVRLALGPVDLVGAEAAATPVLGQLLTLAAARQLAAEINRERALGRDVVGTRYREKLEREARGAATFAQAAHDFISQHAMVHTRRWQEQARLLGLHPNLTVIPKGLSDRWSSIPIADIDGDDIHAVVEETRAKGAPGLVRRSKGPTEARARAMYGTLSKLFAWLVQKRRLRQSPCIGVHRPVPPQARDRVLTPAEIVKFWAAADSANQPFGAVLKLLLLTGCRLNEVAGMRRSEISEGVWTVPGTRTKNRRPHAVPLPTLAARVVDGAQGAGDLVFSTTGTTPISGWSKTKRRLDAAMKIPAWRLHDLRRTAATGMADIGIAPHIIEAVLNHVSGHKAGVAGIYNRSAYLPEKTAALTRWAAHVHGLVAGKVAKVLPLRTAP